MKKNILFIYLFLLGLFIGCKNDNEVTIPPSVIEFSPISGMAGTKVLINGENFSPVTNDIKVSINDVDIPVLKSNEEQILIEIPDNDLIGSSPIKIKILDRECITESNFTYLPTKIASFEPVSGGVNTKVKVDINYLHAEITGVTINGVMAKYEFNEGTLWITIPETEPGNYPIVIYTGDKTYSSETTFELKRILWSRTVSTLAGCGMFGKDDGPGSSATFSFTTWWPLRGGICVDTNNNVYVSDPWSCAIRKISSDGIVSTFTCHESRNPDLSPVPTIDWPNINDGVDNIFFWSTDIKVDTHGNIYQVTYNSNVPYLIKFSPDGKGHYMGWSNGISCAIDEERNHFYFMQPNGDIYQKPLDDVGPNAQAGSNKIISNPNITGGMEVDKRTGDLYVVESENNKIVKYEYGNWSNKIIVAGTGESGTNDGAAHKATFDQPWGIAFTPDGNSLLIAGSGVAQPADNNPQKDISIRCINLQTNYVTTFAGGNEMSSDGTEVSFPIPAYEGITKGVDNFLPAAFKMPCSLCVGQDGTVYVIDRRDYKIKKITTTKNE